MKTWLQRWWLLCFPVCGGGGRSCGEDQSFVHLLERCLPWRVCWFNRQLLVYYYSKLQHIVVFSTSPCLHYSRWMKSLSISGSGTRLDRMIMTVWDHSHIQKLWGQLDCTDLASTDRLISVSECLPGLFLRFSVFILRSGERGVQVDPRSEPSLSWSSHYAGGHEVWPERRPRRNWTFEGEGTDICQWGIGNKNVSTNISDIPLQLN